MALDAPDLESLLAHFNDKITMISELIPLAKLCNIISSNSHETLPPFGRKDLAFEDENASSLPDLAALTEMAHEMKTMVVAMRAKLAIQRRKLDQQRDRSYARIAAVKQHLTYLQGNVPTVFRQSRLHDKSKPSQARSKATPAANPTATVVKNKPGTKPAAKAPPARAVMSSTENIGECSCLELFE